MSAYAWQDIQKGMGPACICCSLKEIDIWSLKTIPKVMFTLISTIGHYQFWWFIMFHVKLRFRSCRVPEFGSYTVIT